MIKRIAINKADFTNAFRSAFDMAKNLPEGRYEITIKKYHDERSTLQNSRHWALLKDAGYESESERLTCHYQLCGEYFGWEEPDKMGIRQPIRTSKNLTTVEFMEFDDWICRRAAEGGVIIA